MLSLAQQSALMPERLHGVPAPNVFVALECPDTVNPADLGTALSAVLAENTILHSVFPADRRIPYQHAVPIPDGVFETLRLDPADLNEQLTTDAATPFDLTRDIPIRAQCYELPDDYVLSIAVHPVAADDIGLDVLIRTLIDRYEGRRGPAPAQYVDFVDDQVKALAATPATDADLAYWTERLADLPRVPRAAVGTDRGATTRREVDLDPAALAALRAVHPGAEAAAVIAALVSATVVGAQSDDDIAVGLVDAARAGAEAVIGNFANQLVLRLRPPHGRTVREVVGEAAGIVAEARSHRTTRVEQLAHTLRGPAAYGTDPLFGVLVRVRDEQNRSIDAPWREVQRQTARPAAVDVVIDVVVTTEAVRAAIEFPDALAGLPGIEDFVTGFASRCRQWADDLDAVVAESGAVPFASPVMADDGLRGRGGAPDTDMERVLADAIWHLLELDGEPIGREDTFFSLGGDSISALKLVTLLAERGYTVDVRTVFGHPAIHELAAVIDASRDAGQPARTDTDEYAPMSASGLDGDALRAFGERFSVG